MIIAGIYATKAVAKRKPEKNTGLNGSLIRLKRTETATRAKVSLNSVRQGQAGCIARTVEKMVISLNNQWINSSYADLE